MAEHLLALQGGVPLLVPPNLRFADADSADPWGFSAQPAPDQHLLIRYNVGGVHGAHEFVVFDGTPVLDLDFSTGGLHGLTLARASLGYYRDAAGLLASAAVDTGQFHYDDAGNFLGLRVEEARTNIILRSEEFVPGTWSKTGITATDDATAGPSGAADAATLVEDTGSNVHRLSQTRSVTSGLYYTLSCFAAPLGVGATRYLKISIGGGAFSTGNSSTVVFDLATGALLLTTLNGNTIFGYVDPHLYNGIYRRFELTFLATATGNAGMFVSAQAASTGNIAVFLGDGVSGMKFFGAQLEEGKYASSYIPTDLVAVTRAAATLSMAQPAEFTSTDTLLMVADFYPMPFDGVARSVVSVDDGTANEKAAIELDDAADTVEGNVVDGGVAQTAFTGAYTARALTKVAMLVRASDFAFAVNGGSLSLDTAGTKPTTNTLRIGCGVGGMQINGHVRRARFYNVRRTDPSIARLVL